MTEKKFGIVPKGIAFVPLPSQEKSRHFTFILVPEFTMLAFTAALEPLRIANQLAQQALYSWEVQSESGKPVPSSSGIAIDVDGPIQPAERDTTLFVCAGNIPTNALSPAIVSAVNRHDRFGGIVGGICTGAFALAKAGLLQKRAFTLHWENQGGFTEIFPSLHPTTKKFEIDGRTLTCGGGAASIDMMIELIERDHGRDFASNVSEMCIRRVYLGADEDQRTSMAILLGSRNPALLNIVEMMKANIEYPLSLEEMSKMSGTSRRHIERVFRNVLDQTPGQFYRSIRLDHARNLLSTSNKSIKFIAAASGFESTVHFTKCFKQRYGVTPSKFMNSSK